jgi:hypothetical protein
LPLHQRTTRSWAAAALVAAALAVGGCSSSDSSSPSAVPSSGASATFGGKPPVATAVTIGQVAGSFRQPYHRQFEKHAKRLRKQVGAAVDAWFDGAFVGVSYPRHDFPAAFRTFTGGARHDAEQQRALMTLWAWRNRIDGVVTTKREVALDVLAPHGRPAGVTARVRLRFRTTGDVKRKVTVTGRLFLTQNSRHQWRIFGFDVAKGSVR